ncbi:pre-mRNA-splicing factor CWC25 homolog [Benincasa hispida]|uniref:pre-mRNA-splicing factor CWC25 homolog n=1 Tax=Benincasa hispida TaxID=102211 RepID=UPI0018FFB6BE|nr:pre-mRNA-splicing factor CWC25 homolog [Benincasa hispida]
MALKFLNKKGWHTGSLRNIENVWKAEQKHEAEQKKLDELRKQIQEEKERQEFRLLQEQAGLVPKQERLDFLYESGLAVGKASSSDGFKSLETLPSSSTAAAATEPSSSKEAAVPGALFEDKPHSANDAWRKLHSDPLLIIRQREQQALARVKNNPIQMAMIRKTVEVEKHKEKNPDGKRERKKHRHSKSKRHKDSSSERDYDSEDASPERQRRKHDHENSSKHDAHSHLEDRRSKADSKNERDRDRGSKYAARTTYDQSDRRTSKSNPHDSAAERHHDRSRRDRDSYANNEKNSRRVGEPRSYGSNASETHESRHKHRRPATKLSEEERVARLHEMQQDAELHEEQRWRRLKKAAEDDALEAKQNAAPSSRNFLDTAQKRMYGAEKGGSSTIEESIRRRTYYSQGKSEIEANAFRR